MGDYLDKEAREFVVREAKILMGFYESEDVKRLCLNAIRMADQIDRLEKWMSKVVKPEQLYGGGG